jgi:pimeloyl-ACP methyl ester carboxylesterase
MPARHCIWTLLLCLAVPAAAQQEPDSETHGYTVFVGGTVVGREDVTVTEAADGTTVTSRGRLSGTLDIVTKRAEVRYLPDWTPEALLIDASVNGGDTTIRTTFSGETAVTEGVDGGRQVSHTEVVSYQMLVLPRIFFGAYEALTRQLAADPSSNEFRAFVAAGSQVALRVRRGDSQRMQTGTSTFDVQHYELIFDSPTGEVIANLYADTSGTLVRLDVPSQTLDVVRDDLASATARTVTHSNPGDEAVIIPARGFNLGATLTRPAGQAEGARLPAVVLLGGSASNERDGVLAGVPIVGQLAGAAAEAGFLAVRYDKRGYGQSGGRAESATLGDFAEDARTVVRWLADRRDVDRDRIAIVGHSEGAWVAMLTASREGRVAAVVAIATPSTTGSEVVLEQQRAALDALNASQADRDAKIELQQKINAAVVSGRGWEEIPPEIRKQADTPWFQSFLAFEPAEVLEDLDQPILFVHGALDMQVPPSHVDRIAELAREESDSRSVSSMTIAGVNHLLVPAPTGGVGEYASLQDLNVSADVTGAITEWLTRTFAAIR